MTTPESSAPVEPAAVRAEAAPTSPAPFRLGNQPALTGIRALGMACVLVYHANFGAMTGAWAALQIFFVLSGFLITYLMASEARNRGKISLTGFYSRRAVRLLPPLLLAVVLVAIYASFVHVWDVGQRVWGDSLAALFYYADYRSATGHAPYLGFFAQAWSLSVEEQFYIVWAVLLAVVVARGAPAPRLLDGRHRSRPQRRRPYMDGAFRTPCHGTRGGPCLLFVRHPGRRPVLWVPPRTLGRRRVPAPLAPVGAPRATGAAVVASAVLIVDSVHGAGVQ